MNIDDHQEFSVNLDEKATEAVIHETTSRRREGGNKTYSSNNDYVLRSSFKNRDEPNNRTDREMVISDENLIH